MALRKEQDELSKEKATIEALLASEKKQWQMIAVEIRDVKKKFGPDTKLGRRRTSFEAAPDVIVADLAEAMIEREPLTIVVSQKGWIRALKGQVADLSTATFKGDDGLKTSFFAETTSKILVLASDGKVFTLEASKLPGGRGQGEPIRLMADIDESASIVAVWAYAAGAKRLIASSDGNGFVVGDDELLSSTRKGRAVLNVTRAGDRGADRSRRRRPCRDHRAEPQASCLPVRRSSTKWRAARARGFSATRTAAFPTPRFSPSPTGSPGAIRPGARSPSQGPSSRNGSAIAPKPAACRRRAFRRTTGSRDRAATASCATPEADAS